MQSRVPSHQAGMEFPMPTDSPERLTWPVKEFCKATGISNSLFYELVKQNKIRTIKVGCRRLVPNDEVTRILRCGT